MSVDIHMDGMIVAYLLVLSRVAGLLIFLPIPGLRALPDALRPLVAIALAVPFVKLLPEFAALPPTPGVLALWCLSELCFGLIWGIAVHFLLEAFVLGAQFLALQAGFGYASIIDPSTQADAGLLQIVLQLMASLLFFAAGIHRQVIFLLGESLRRVPLGGYVPAVSDAESLIALGAAMIEVAARLALPLIALLLLIDVSLALLGRVQAQLQLLSMIFPAKLLASLFVLGILAGTYAKVYRDFGTQVIDTLTAVIVRGGQ